MKKLASVIGVIALSATAATAGGIDRGRLTYGALYEKGNYVEFGFSHVKPKVSGTYGVGVPGAGTSTGDMAGDYTTFSFSYKRDINEKLSYGIFVNTPYGASASYPQGLYTGLQADWDSKQVAVVLRYKLEQGFSIHGGLKAVRSKPTIAIPNALIAGGLQRVALTGSGQAQAQAQGILVGYGGANPQTYSGATGLEYGATGEADTRVAGIIGVAYEKPEIALRVALTYESGFTHKFNTTETSIIPGIGRTGTTEIEMPQTVTLDFQTGVAANTLVFGSIRWAEWSKWEVRPAGYEALTGGNITDFENDVITYQLGVGRKLTDNFSVFARVGYEKSNAGVASRLAPTDGSKSFGIGGSFTQDGMKITAGLEYAKLGDAVDGSGTKFEGNKAVGFGVTVGYSF
jgi:long-chain fatty acid transport protein